MYYRNISFGTKTFYGVTFQPGDIKEVKAFINDPKMLLMPKDYQPAAPVVKPSKSTKAVTKVNKSAKSDKAEVKPEITKEEESDGKDSDQ